MNCIHSSWINLRSVANQFEAVLAAEEFNVIEAKFLISVLQLEIDDFKIINDEKISSEDVREEDLFAEISSCDDYNIVFLRLQAR